MPELCVRVGTLGIGEVEEASFKLAPQRTSPSSLESQLRVGLLDDLREAQQHDLLLGPAGSSDLASILPKEPKEVTAHLHSMVNALLGVLTLQASGKIVSE